MSNISIFQKQGIQLLPDNKSHELRFEVKSESSNNLYVIARNKSNKKWSCGCRGWIRHRHCKHLLAVESLITNVEKQEKIA
jgi:hypothetical protein